MRANEVRHFGRFVSTLPKEVRWILASHLGVTKRSAKDFGVCQTSAKKACEETKKCEEISFLTLSLLVRTLKPVCRTLNAVFRTLNRGLTFYTSFFTLLLWGDFLYTSFAGGATSFTLLLWG